MRERVLIVGSIVVLLLLLVGLNAASYVRVEREPELEARPDRSTYNAGATGTRALYDYLNETGQRVVRWRDPATALVDPKRRRPDTFVIVGRQRVPYTKEEVVKLRQWVEAGGRLVVIDRAAEPQLLPRAADYIVYTDPQALPGYDVRADDAENLTRGAHTLAPTQPALLTRDVEQIAPSRFAARIKLNTVALPDASTQLKADARAAADEEEDEDEESPPAPRPAPPAAAQPSPAAPKLPPRGGAQGPRVTVETDDAQSAEEEQQPPAPAPVFLLTDEHGGALLADYAAGRGHVTLLTDPFIVANNGIERADNLQLALNLVTAGGGLIAFDEYHQGRGATENEFVAYFVGTPVLALCGQALLVVLAVVWTRGRRFARPLPAPRADRRSKLEFVASMAELQQRARAYDLAVENVYARTRRALARYGGVQQNVPRAQVAARVAARSGLNRDELEALMRECEDAINGEPIRATRALALVRRLRELERTLGIRMRAREIKQAAAR